MPHFYYVGPWPWLEPLGVPRSGDAPGPRLCCPYPGPRGPFGITRSALIRTLCIGIGARSFNVSPWSRPPPPHMCSSFQALALVCVSSCRGDSPTPSPGPAGPHQALVCPLASQDRTCEIVEDTESSRMVKKMKKRICLVLDCLCAHDFSDKTADLINLQHYVIKEKRLSERETVVIFYDVVRVVEALHQVRPCPPAPPNPSSSSWPVLGSRGPRSLQAPLPQKATLSPLLRGSSSGAHPPPGVLCSWNVQKESG